MSQPINHTEAEFPKVLVIDDEASILQSIKRLLRRHNINVLLAQSGQEGLELLTKHDVQLVICDMKMPNMTGAELFTQVAKRYPNIYRILLTGFSDVDSTIDAINLGKIDRYVQKPWDNDHLVSEIIEGLDKHKLKQENIRLQALLKKQNKLLKDLNSNLDKKINLRTKQIRKALHQIEHDHKSTQKVIYNLININPLLSGSFAKSVSLLSTQLADSLELSQEQTKQISFAGLICEIGKLGLAPELCSTPFTSLTPKQRDDFQEHTNIAQMILNPADHLQPIVDIIACQNERLTGDGKYKLTAKQIPIGAKILAVAADYWRLTLGKTTGEEMTFSEVKTEMSKHIGTKYDPEILDILFSLENEISDTFIQAPLAVEELVPGMVLKQDIYTPSHMLLLPEGHVLTDKTIAKLSNYQTRTDADFTIVVAKEPSAPSA